MYILKIENITNSVIPIRKDYIDLINVDINCPLYFEAPIYKNSKLSGAKDIYSNPRK